MTFIMDHKTNLYIYTEIKEKKTFICIFFFFLDLIKGSINKLGAGNLIIPSSLSYKTKIWPYWQSKIA